MRTKDQERNLGMSMKLRQAILVLHDSCRLRTSVESSRPYQSPIELLHVWRGEMVGILVLKKLTPGTSEGKIPPYAS